MNEITELRTANSAFFDLGNGSIRAEIGNHSFVDKGGLFIPVNNTLANETGTDPDVGFPFVVSNHSTQHPFYIKFGKENPAYFKMKVVGDNTPIIVFKPRNNQAFPEHEVNGNVLTVYDVWDGIDMIITLHDRGIKTDYRVKNSSGQRIIEYDVEGDVGTSFRTGRPWYRVPGEVPTFIPVAFANGVLSYDFRNVPVGTLVDPSVSFQPDSTGTDTTIDALSNANWGNTAWYGTGQLSGAGGGRSWRGLIKFDLSSLTTGSYLISNSYLTLVVMDGTAGSYTATIRRMRRLWNETAIWQKASTDGALDYWGQDPSTADASAYGASNTTSDVYGTDSASVTYTGIAANSSQILTGSGLDSDITAMLANPAVNFGWRLHGLEGGSEWAQYFSFDHATASNRPTLGFDYVVLDGSTPTRRGHNPYPFGGSPQRPFKTR